MGILIESHGKGYRLQAQQRFPQNPEDIFCFFANASNLEQITPPQLHFRIMTPLPIEMRKGALIEYKIRLRGIPINWRTEITAWDPPYRFVDMQLRGPYSWWIHEHTFETRDGITTANDTVEYGMPLGFLAHPLLVKNDLMNIFKFRQRVLAQQFGSCE